jgi:guanylate kinase
MFKSYIAGALNSDAVGYIKNLHNMIVRSEEVRRMGVAVFVPGIDAMVGITMGDLEYNDYFDNSQPWLESSDFVTLTPGWENSTGTIKEIALARSKNIPVFENLADIKNFIKPHIICIIGESGSGKSVLADSIEAYGYKLIQSYTTRPPRHDNESGHTFISLEEFNAFNRQEMIAYTEFGGNKYCCLHKDIISKNVYVLDDHGYEYLKTTFSDIYNIFAVRINTLEKQRMDYVSEERASRDAGKFFLGNDSYDCIWINTYNTAELVSTAKEVVKASITKFSTL